MRSIYGLAALLAMPFDFENIRPEYRPQKPKRKLPEQTRPITDSTPESKRARRRRLAREKQS